MTTNNAQFKRDVRAIKCVMLLARSCLSIDQVRLQVGEVNILAYDQARKELRPMFVYWDSIYG